MKILELMANYGFFTDPLVEKGATVFKVDQALYPNLDLAINAIVGTSGLRPTIELIKNNLRC